MGQKLLRIFPRKQMSQKPKSTSHSYLDLHSHMQNRIVYGVSISLKSLSGFSVFCASRLLWGSRDWVETQAAGWLWQKGPSQASACPEMVLACKSCKIRESNRREKYRPFQLSLPRPPPASGHSGSSLTACNRERRTEVPLETGEGKRGRATTPRV